MNAAKVLTLVLIAGCSTSSTTGSDRTDAGGGDATAATEAGSSANGDASSEAGTCPPLEVPKGLCTRDGDCPSASNARGICCAVVFTDESCDFPVIREPSCTVGGGCADAKFDCDPTTGSQVNVHMCANALDCRKEQRCCSLCRGGHTQSVCLLPEDGAKFGADCL